MPGKFITFEGGEGVGKTTQSALLRDKLCAQGHDVVLTREPGGTSIAEGVRSLLKSSAASTIDPMAECLMMFAARKDHFEHIIRPSLDSGKIVICDRFYDSTLVYQGLLKSVSFEDIMQLKLITLGKFEPNLTIVLDMDPSISQYRTKKRSNNIELFCNIDNYDEYDEMTLEKHKLIREGFKKITEIFSFRTKLINAKGSEQRIAEKIYTAVADFLFT